MANRHMKRRSRNCFQLVRETQIKATMSSHLTPVRMSIIEKTRMSKCCEDVEKRESLYRVGRNVNWFSHFENSMEAPQTIKNRAILKK